MNSKPLYRVGAAGLDPRDWRLIEIVFKHSQYNKYEFRLLQDVSPDAIDILIVNTIEPEGVKAVSVIRAGGRSIPIIAAVPRGAPSSARHAISIDRLTLQLLPILNRVVELELLNPETRPMPTGFAEVARPAPMAAAQPPSQPGSHMSSSAPAHPGLQAAATGQPAQAASATQPNSPMPGAATPGNDARAVPPAMPASRPLPDASRAPPARPAPTLPEAVPARAPGSQLSNLVAFPLGSSMDSPASQRLRVLVVDDSPTVRQQLTLAFERMGMACEVAASANAAFERLAERHFDLALVDVIMPEMDGYKLTREIKRNKKYRQMPVIILTSKSSPFDLARGALAGCDTYLTKPVPLKALESAVVKQLRKALAIDDLSALIRVSTQPSPLPSARPAPLESAGARGQKGAP